MRPADPAYLPAPPVSPAKITVDHLELAERLDVALDAVLFVRLALGGLTTPQVAEEALDVALGAHARYQEARRGFLVALEAVRSAGVPDEVVFNLEAAAHHLGGQAAEVGWALGVTARRGST